MTYYISATVAGPFDEAVERTTRALADQGFGVVTQIDMKETLKKKIGVDFRNYRILGACNPAAAHEALQLEDKVGTMLPCNVIVQEREDGAVEVAAIDPVASMKAIENPALLEKAGMIRDRLASAVRSL